MALPFVALSKKCKGGRPAIQQRGHRWHWVAGGMLAPLLSLILVGYWDSVVAADIRATPHNLARSKPVVEAEEVCVFCHTPMLAPNTAGRSSVAARPAWQRSLPLDHTFVMFDDIGRLQFGDKPAVGSQSIACLSCHDANQAFSVMAADSDHPFGIPYRGYRKGQVQTATEQSKDKDKDDDGASRSAVHLKALDEFRIPSRGVVDSRSVWWVSAKGESATRTRVDLPLYARKGENGNGEIPYVECSSCHDPHITNKLFLRVNNDGGSRLCLTCHDK